MQGTRPYAVLRKVLLQACDQINTKGLRLSERVFMPEAFALDAAAEIAKRHRKALSVLWQSDSSRQFKMMVVIGELKELARTDLLPLDATTRKLVKSVSERRNGREEEAI